MPLDWNEILLDLWNTAEIKDRPRALLYVERMLKSVDRYKAVEEKSEVPWFVVGIIHGLEAAARFTRHIHNGDPLDARTVKVPAGRPKTGTPPFTWEESAADAMTIKRKPKVWDIVGVLDYFERYNGLGNRPRYPKHLSPYIWGATNHETKGKYVADGVWDPNVTTKQAGAAAQLLILCEDGYLDFKKVNSEPVNDIKVYKKGVNVKLSDHFSSKEMDCKCSHPECVDTPISSLLISVLEEVRSQTKSPIHIISGYRCAKQNKKVLGAPKSQHLLGKAADIVSKTHLVKAVHTLSKDALDKVLGKDKGGLGSYPTFTHVDVRDTRAYFTS